MRECHEGIPELVFPMLTAAVQTYYCSAARRQADLVFQQN